MIGIGSLLIFLVPALLLLYFARPLGRVIACGLRADGMLRRFQLPKDEMPMDILHPATVGRTVPMRAAIVVLGVVVASTPLVAQVAPLPVAVDTRIRISAPGAGIPYRARDDSSTLPRRRRDRGRSGMPLHCPHERRSVREPRLAHFPSRSMLLA